MQKGPILVPVDFEDASQNAIELARGLAQGVGAELALVHVYHLPIYTYPGFDPAPVLPYSTEVRDAAHKALEQLAASLGISRALLREGDTATEILAAADEVGASMIVMGTHGRGRLAHLLLGSVAEKVVRRSPVPVTTVRGPAKSRTE